MTLEDEQIIRLIEQMDRESRAIKDDSMKMAWFMRGGITYDDALTLSFQEREIVGNIIKKNLETTKESGLPFF